MSSTISNHFCICLLVHMQSHFGLDLARKERIRRRREVHKRAWRASV